MNEIKVFIAHRESKCAECGNDLGSNAWICLKGEPGSSGGALCLACADIDHLVYLPAGDAAMSRRSRKYSALSAVVLKWSRARKRYERQGILVEEAALEKAEQECLEDSEARERRQVRGAERRSQTDAEYVRRFARRIRELFPHAPPGREQKIAEHACMKYSGRVGRTAAAKEFEPAAVRLAVVASIRHTETGYDTFLSQGMDRGEARHQVQAGIEAILEKWVGE